MTWLSTLPLVFLLAGCPLSGDVERGAVDDGTLPDPNGPRGCTVDSDCELASATCCDCPSFALPVGDAKLGACDGVQCPPPQATCTKIRAACDANVCVVACQPEAVTQSCPAGFATDMTGCLIDQCATPLTGCQLDSDCVRTREDCCGCARGGADTAVPAGERAGYDATLGCTQSPQCPEVNTCDGAETPQCAQGTCKLIAGGLPGDACGRPDLAACPAGTVCTVNASDPANLHGVGVCRTP